MWPRVPYDPGPYDDDFEDQPKQGAWYQWVPGAIVPLLILSYGIAVVMKHETIYGGRLALRLHGSNAIAIGVAAISLAIFLHCHYFWGNVYDQAWPAVLGKIIAACGFIAGLGFVIVRVGVLGIR